MAAPRALHLIEADIRVRMARRAPKVAARNQRDEDMLAALRDVEELGVSIAEDDARLEALFAERDRALAAQTQSNTTRP